MGANPDDDLNKPPSAPPETKTVSSSQQHEDPASTITSTTSSTHPSSSSSLAELTVQNEAQLNAIQSNIEENQPLTSIQYSVTSLRDLYEPDSNFDRGVQYLARHYRFVRRVRGDGNCFYRALLYRLCEELKESETERLRVLALVQTSIDTVTRYGYERFALEVFHEELVELLDKKLPVLSLEQLHSTLNEANATSDYCTWYLRILTACHLKSDVPRFEAFLALPHISITAFCQAEVEPMGKDCDMLQVMALAEALQIRVVVEYLDGRDELTNDGALQRHVFGNQQETEETSALVLLYRPGHYDILYK